MNAECPHVAALNADIFSFFFSLQDETAPRSYSLDAFFFKKKNVTLLDYKAEFPRLDLISIPYQHPSFAEGIRVSR